MGELVVCSRCGHVIDASDPTLAHLPPATVAVWQRIMRPLKGGKRLGSTQVGQLAMMSPQAAEKHLRRLARAGLVKAEPKRRGGRYRVYVAAE